MKLYTQEEKRRAVEQLRQHPDAVIGCRVHSSRDLIPGDFMILGRRKWIVTETYDEGDVRFLAVTTVVKPDGVTAEIVSPIDRVDTARIMSQSEVEELIAMGKLKRIAPVTIVMG